MPAPRIKLSNFGDIPDKVGLKDGGHVILSCSACGEPLVDIWVIKAHAVDPRTGKPLEWRMVARCWKCGDRSFETAVKGRYALGAYGRDVPNPDPGGMNDSKLSSVVTRVEEQGDVLVFHTKQAGS